MKEDKNSVKYLIDKLTLELKENTKDIKRAVKLEEYVDAADLASVNGVLVYVIQLLKSHEKSRRL